MELIILTTDKDAFNATGLVFEAAYAIQLTEDQVKQLQAILNRELIVKVVLKNQA